MTRRITRKITDIVLTKRLETQVTISIKRNRGRDHKRNIAWKRDLRLSMYTDNNKRSY